MAQIEERVDRLEQAHADFTRLVGIEFNKFYNGLTSLQMEMREFKNEMREFKNEMHDFKDEMLSSKIDMNKKWGDMANKLGTITEDLVHPSLPRIVKEKFGAEIDSFAINILQRRASDGKRKEFDAILVAQDKVYLTSTKSSMRNKYIDNFVAEISELRSYFPAYENKKIVGIMASLSLNEDMLNYASKAGLLMLTIGENLMDIQNAPDFVPKYW